MDALNNQLMYSTIAQAISMQMAGVNIVLK
jgi:hypothetical protein